MKRIISLITLLLLVISTFSYADLYSPYKNGYIEGYLKYITADKMQVEEYDGTLHTLNFTKDVKFRIDNRDAQKGDFISGMEIYASLKGKSISVMESYSNQNPGYIKAGSKIRIGNYLQNR